MKKKYWIIDLENMGELYREARGPFKSVAEAEESLRKDAADWFADYNDPESLGENLNWSLPVLIVEEKKKIQQVPVVKFEIKLKTLKNP
jgi:hypothetical protein